MIKLQILPLKGINYGNLLKKIVLANRKVAEYNAYIQTIPNPAILLNSLTTKEAVVSSRIEGTQATLEEVVQYQDKLKTSNKKFADIQEVINYRKALLYSVDRIKEYPLCLSFIREVHNILIDGVRGENKDKGNFRKIQNRIGRPGTKIEEALYVPPSLMEMNKLLDNLEKYFHIEDIDVLVQIGIIHAQFELIHPFLDGNGRIGRLLIPLFLFYKKILTFPSFYMSEYFDICRDEYYMRLNNISKKGDREGWIIFFLDAVIFQSNKNLERLTKIISLFEVVKEEIGKSIHSNKFMEVVDFLFSKPIFYSGEFAKVTKVSKISIYRYLNILQEKKILKSDNKNRNKTYFFKELLNIIG